MSAAKPVVYLDQNVLSAMARAPGGWRGSDHGRVLIDFPEAESWISPSHVVELVLHPDGARRTEMANMMLEMTDSRRIAPDYAFEVIEGFMQTLEKACPNIVVSRAYLDAAINPTSQLFLAALAMMATGRPPRSDVVESVTRRKVENRWLRAEAGADPDAWLDKVEDAARNLTLMHGEPRPELAGKTLAELATEIRAFEDQAERISDRTRLIKLTPIIVRAYAVGDVFEALGATFEKLPGDLIFTFNFAALANVWTTEFVHKRGCAPLPAGTQLLEHATWMIAEAAKSFWRPENGTIVAAEIAQGVIIGHYLERLNERGRERKKRLEHERKTAQLPTDSLTFDADHASLALRRADVFVTLDENLREISSKLAAGLAEKVQHRCSVVGTPTELRAALENLKASPK